MLASVTPLGERSRGFSWPLTATSFGLAALAAGVTAGCLAGAVGSLAPAGGWRSMILLVALLVAVGCDATALRRWLPSTRRQVNEDWLRRYRGWVYGAAFGGQLGVGVATIVTSAAVYVTALGTVLAGSPVAGAIVGGAFGTCRGLGLLPARSAKDWAGLTRLQARLTRLGPATRWLVVSAEILAAAMTLQGLT